MGPSIYDKASGRGSLKLKGQTTGTTTKKKNKRDTNTNTNNTNNDNTNNTNSNDNDNHPPDESVRCSASPTSSIPPPDSSSSCMVEESLLDDLSGLTPAERSFRLAQQKREHKRVDERLKLTHRQRMERLNAHLASLSEHFDIPKVGPG
eukprot:GHVS01056580.1.p1 GENE.GHVS01056580.1~~GHVS01056580.1.p1  ORF type:complete len:149 (-),score=46.37 GHVS01056580.1:255-701(-)